MPSLLFKTDSVAIRAVTLDAQLRALVRANASPHGVRAFLNRQVFIFSNAETLQRKPVGQMEWAALREPMRVRLQAAYNSDDPAAALRDLQAELPAIYRHGINAHDFHAFTSSLENGFASALSDGWHEAAAARSNTAPFKNAEFSDAASFDEAIALRKARTILPTDLGTGALRELSGSVKRQAMFSAHTTYGGYLQNVNNWIERILKPDGAAPGQTLNKATVRLRMKQELQSLGYVPSAEDAGTLRDLGSDERLDLIIQTNIDIDRGYGWRQQGMDPEILSAWPAQELFRYADSDYGPEFNRGEAKSHSEGWEERWAKAADAADDLPARRALEEHGRMVARKDSAIWDFLGSSELFDDGIDNPYPPFAFNSHMEVRDVDRAEAVALEVIGEDDEVEPDDLELEECFGASLANDVPALRDAIVKSLRGLAKFGKDGVLRMEPGE